jgi:hypothetical protein
MKSIVSCIITTVDAMLYIQATNFFTFIWNIQSKFYYFHVHALSSSKQVFILHILQHGGRRVHIQRGADDALISYH